MSVFWKIQLYFGENTVLFGANTVVFGETFVDPYTRDQFSDLSGHI